MTPFRVLPEGDVLDILLEYSADWEAEGSCYGYRRNTPEDFQGEQVFVMIQGSAIVAYLMGHRARAERMQSIMPDGTSYFEVDELYVVPEYRSRGVGRALFRFMEEEAAYEAEFIMLSTASKNFRAALHFYLDELGMEFWSARLFKPLRKGKEKPMGFIDRELLPGVHHIEDALGVCFTLIVGERRALLVDAGYGVEDVKGYVGALTDKPLTLWLTHGHHDHAPGAMGFDSVRMHPAEGEVYRLYTSEKWRRNVLETARGKGVAVDEAAYLAAPMPEPQFLEGETIDLGGLTAQVIPCPGHTPGSVVVWVPERRLLLTGDDWNPCTWLFFPEALSVWQYRENVRSLLKLPFEHVICPHRTALYPRATFEAFVNGLTDEAIAAARPVDTGAKHGVRTREAELPKGQVLVFDGDKAERGRIR